MVAALATAVVSLGLVLAAARFGWLGPDVGRGSGFCEAPSGGWVVQPVNTWSNLGFVTAGLAVAAYAADRARLGLTMGAHPGLAVTFAVVVVLLGPGSMAMHATQTRLGGHLDLLSMFLVSGFALAYAVMRLVRRGPGLFVALFPVLVVVGMVVLLTGGRMPFVRHSGNAAFAVMILLAVVVEVALWLRRTPRQDAAFGLASVAVLLVAYTVWQFGRRDHAWCEPESLLQWHGVWHVLCALAAYLMFRHDTGERSVAR